MTWLEDRDCVHGVPWRTCPECEREFELEKSWALLLRDLGPDEGPNR